jgi:hypothetical protein
MNDQTNWMKALSVHFKNMREKYPNEKIMIVFDIDDTIVDIRIALLYVLKKYDHINGTDYFTDFLIDSIEFEEWSIQHWIETYIENKVESSKVVLFLRENLWREDTVLLSHRPFRGVLEVIRWFQIQKNTYVALNTGRSEDMRDLTLESLNIIGKEFRVKFNSEFLYMNPIKIRTEDDIKTYKSKGIKYYQSLGYKVIAFLDNEPINLQAVATALDDPDILLMHADTMFSSPKELVPLTAMTGSEYIFTDIIQPNLLPRHVEFVWNGVNDLETYQNYIDSNVHWAELDVRVHPMDQELVLKHSSFDNVQFKRSKFMKFDEMIEKLSPSKRGIKLTLKEGHELLLKVLNQLEETSVENDLWFDIIFEMFDIEGLNQIKRHYPEAIISTRVDFLVPLLSQFPKFVEDILRNLTKIGINQFSVSLHTYNKELFLEKLDDMKYDLNIRDVISIEEFMQALILLPKSIITNFDF